MIYRVINPALDNPDAAYPMVVAAVVPAGLRGLVVAAILSAIMSTISGLVNSTSTMVTLDIFQRWKGKDWSEARLVSVGRWSGAVALLIGALFAPVVMRWQNIFRYAQDIWAPMAAPIVVVFLAGALWPKANNRGAVTCIWLAILTVPFTLIKSILADYGIHLLPPNLENPMVFSGAVSLISIGLIIVLAGKWSAGAAFLMALPIFAFIGWIAVVSPTAMALLVLVGMVGLVGLLMVTRRTVADHLWDQSMFDWGSDKSWYRNLWVWWLVLAAILVGIYIKFW
jgi:SSS family solute:Na+ symporter